MLRPSLPRIVLTALLLSALFVPGARAEAPSSTKAVFSWVDLLGRAWGGLLSLWQENGCSVDPSGGCAPEQGGAQPDNGCSLDPDGRCAPQPSADNGCSADPNGGCGS